MFRNRECVSEKEEAPCHEMAGGLLYIGERLQVEILHWRHREKQKW